MNQSIPSIIAILIICLKPEMVTYYLLNHMKMTCKTQKEIPL